MIDVSSAPLQAVNLEHILLGGLLLWIGYNQFLKPWRDAGVRRGQFYDRTDDKLSALEKQVTERLHKDDFAPYQKALEHHTLECEKYHRRVEKRFDKIERKLDALTAQLRRRK